MLFNNFINDLEEGEECGLTKFADVTKLGGLAVTLEGWAAIQSDLARLEKKADRKLMKFNRERC